MKKMSDHSVARDKAVERQLLRRSNAAVPHRNGRAKEEARQRKHRGRAWKNEEYPKY